MIKHNLSNKLVIIGIFLLVFLIALYTPMQSDDYSFYLMGLSFSAHLEFYMTWSGRLVADYLSTAILGFNNPILVAFISSLATPILIYNIATTPLYQCKSNTRLGLVFFLLFAIYWLANPALGQTTFWIVGECNYLWPLVFVSAYIKYLLNYFYQENISAKQYSFIIILALLSGCSNEATGALVIYFTVAMLLFALYNKLANKKIILIALAVTLIGYAILILAPGNFVRAMHPEFAQWRTTPLVDRLSMHLFRTMPDILKSYGVAYFVLVWALYQGKGFLTKQQWQLIIINIMGCFIFAFILVASPAAIKTRTHLTGLFFLLVATSFALNAALQYTQHITRLAKALFICLLIGFFLSYSVVFFAYRSLTAQFEQRMAILQAQKAKGLNAVIIPNYFAPFVLKEGDLPEISHHSSGAMANYYGLKSVALVFVEFDYAKVLNSHCPVSLSKKQNERMACIYKSSVLLSGITSFTVQFKPNISHANNYALTISNQYDKKNENYYNITVPLRVLKIGESYFATAQVVTNLLYPESQSEAFVSLLTYDGDKLIDASDPILIKE